MHYFYCNTKRAASKFKPSSVKVWWNINYSQDLTPLNRCRWSKSRLLRSIRRTVNCVEIPMDNHSSLLSWHPTLVPYLLSSNLQQQSVFPIHFHGCLVDVDYLGNRRKRRIVCWTNRNFMRVVLHNRCNRSSQVAVIT